MEKILVEGGKKLFGKTDISGMKNSALPIIFACLLIEDECIIENVPVVSDVLNSLTILNGMGAKAEFIDSHTVCINAKNACNKVKNKELISKMRASSYLMGASLAKMGGIEIPLPGGCNFGSRPLEQHIKGFKILGAECYEQDNYISIFAKNLKNNKIVLDKISVGATINMVLASVLLEGNTVIENVACEPHVDDLINFLNSCGADISRKPNEILVKGVKKLHGAKYKIYPDMIEALTYITCVGVCSGKIELNHVEPKHLSYSCDIFEKMGFEIVSYENRVIIKAGNNIKGHDIITAPYPFFPTDLHPQFASLLCFTKNGGKIREEIFPNRFAYVKELNKMGAKIERNSNEVIIYPSEMTGCDLDATDLRAGASLIVASLGAIGKSTINNVNYIVRGYENIVEKISSLGGEIKYI